MNDFPDLFIMKCMASVLISGLSISIVFCFMVYIEYKENTTKEKKFHLN